ncbi:COG4315 family predicted lipoprotein [Pseudonocardia alni]|uniref:Lipoprotein with Yx(FWY)xxD motif n=1 Tax=Pseudonocardia alni TaxID=33907 RepID=A0AA44URI0_PSEA5|nr:hypothetical protein [Pseudonocardia alni]PKB31864.1 putative lipoprotein with Yx(FWY)xxD motif [Pseudonocardia alni]
MPAPSRHRVALLLAAAALSLGACTSAEPAGTERAFTLPGAGTTIDVVTSTAGAVLADGQGRVLYARVPAGECAGECLAQWPAYVAEGVPHPARPALNPLRTEVIGTTATAGGEQVTYAGHVLHRFAGDTTPGAVTGQGVEAFGGTWLPLNPNGDPVPAPAVR